MAAMKIQDSALVMSYDSSNRFISRRLINDVSFMSISFIVFKKWGGGGTGFDAPPPVQGRPKKPSLNRINSACKTSISEALM